MVAVAGNAPHVEVSTALQHPRENVFLLTVFVKVIGAHGSEYLARALLDSASQPNLITDRMAKIIRLRRQSANVTVQGAGQLSKPITESVFAQMQSRKGNFSCGVSFLVMDKVTADLPSQTVSTAGWKISENFFMADPSFNECQPIDMVLGARHFYSFFPSNERIQLNRNVPLLVNNVFGWIVAGSSNADSLAQTSMPVISCSTVEVSMVSLEECEELTNGRADCLGRCESLYQTTVSRNEKGRYMVQRDDWRIPE